MDALGDATAVMKLGEQLAVDLAGRIPGFDDPSVGLAWLGGRDPLDVVTAIVGDLSPADRVEFVATLADEPWTGIVVAHCRHPWLAELVAWAEAHPEVILLASPSGPIPPAVLALDRSTGLEGPG